jgi:hypothetical protein
VINMMVYPIVANVNGRTVAGHKSQEGALGVASAVNRFAGSELVHVGEPFESELTSGVLHVDGGAVALNPAYALAKDPYRDALNRMVGTAAQPRKRTRKTTGTAPRAAKTTGARSKVSANA